MARQSTAKPDKKRVCANCGGTIRRGSLTAWMFGRNPDACMCGLTQEKALNQTAAPAMPEAAPFAVGDRIANRYELLELMGNGASGCVYKAFDEKFDGRVAIKVLRSSLLQDQFAVKRFEREAEAARGLSHPNIVKVHDFDVHEGSLPYLVMDYAEGTSLASIISKEGPLEENRAVKLFLQIAAGIRHAHSKGIVHRDLKPANVVVHRDESGNDHVKIVDLGIAKLGSEIGNASLTADGEIFGSPLYMSPEQCRGEALDLRSDIYSFGCLMFETLTGDPPFVADNPIQIVVKHLNEAPEQAFERLSDRKISESMQTVILRSLAKLAEDRYQNADALYRDLKGISIGQRIRKSASRSISKAWAIGVVSAAVLAVLGFSTQFAIQHLRIVNPSAKQSTNGSRRAQWLALDVAAQQSFDAGNLKQAHDEFNSALQIANGGSPNNAFILATLEDLIDLDRASGQSQDLSDVRQQLEMAQDNLASNFAQSQHDVSLLGESTGKDKAASTVSSALECAHQMSAMGMNRHALALVDATAPYVNKYADATYKARLLLTRGTINDKLHNYSEAAKDLKTALGIEQHQLSSTDPLYAKTLQQLGIVALSDPMVEPKQAEDFLQCAIEAQARTSGQTSLPVADIRATLSQLLLNEGKAGDAAAEAKRALGLLSDLDAEGTPVETQCNAVIALAERQPAQLAQALRQLEFQTQKQYQLLAQVLLASAQVKHESSMKDRAQAILQRFPADVRTRFDVPQ